MSMDTAQIALMHERIARGAALMDKQDPTWPSRVNVETIDQASITTCVVSQAFGGDMDDKYFSGVERLGLGNPYDTNEAREHGFSCQLNSEYTAYTAAWKALVAGRQRAMSQVLAPEPAPNAPFSEGVVTSRMFLVTGGDEPQLFSVREDANDYVGDLLSMGADRVGVRLVTVRIVTQTFVDYQE